MAITYGGLDGLNGTVGEITGNTVGVSGVPDFVRIVYNMSLNKEYPSSFIPHAKDLYSPSTLGK